MTGILPQVQNIGLINTKRLDYYNAKKYCIQDVHSYTYLLRKLQKKKKNTMQYFEAQVPSLLKKLQLFLKQHIYI